jgi:hypothetical protein
LETSLYRPVKRFLEKLGCEVKGEVCGCDLVALDAPPLVVIGELKPRFNLDLVLQGVDRMLNRSGSPFDCFGTSMLGGGCSPQTCSLVGMQIHMGGTEQRAKTSRTWKERAWHKPISPIASYPMRRLLRIQQPDVVGAEMKIGIIGSGQIGGTLARRLTALEHQVFVANSRGPETLTDLAAETGATAVSVGEAVRGVDLVSSPFPKRIFRTYRPGCLQIRASGGRLRERYAVNLLRQGKFEGARCRLHRAAEVKQHNWH